jgi:hypothetical protein
MVFLPGTVGLIATTLLPPEMAKYVAILNHQQQPAISPMPHTITLEETGLYREFSGTVSGEEILESNFHLHTLPQFHQFKYVINDFSAMRDHSIELAHTHAYATSDQVIATTKESLRIAMVVTRPDHVELARHYLGLMAESHFECNIFHNLAQARAWAHGG